MASQSGKGLIAIHILFNNLEKLRQSDNETWSVNTWNYKMDGKNM